jgi:hypothetical protein
MNSRNPTAKTHFRFWRLPPKPFVKNYSSDWQRAKSDKGSTAFCTYHQNSFGGDLKILDGFSRSPQAPPTTTKILYT